MKPYILIVISSFILVSCASVKPPPIEKGVALNSTNYKLLDGTYKNLGTNGYDGANMFLWGDMGTDDACRDIPSFTSGEPTPVHLDTTDTCHTCYIQIKTVNKHKIIATLISDKKVLKTKIFRGRITDGVFLAKGRHSYKFPALILIWATGSSSFELGINTEKQLVVNSAEECAAIILILPFISSHSQTENIYALSSAAR